MQVMATSQTEITMTNNPKDHWADLIKSVQQNVRSAADTIRDLQHKVTQVRMTGGVFQNKDRYIDSVNGKMLGRMVAYMYNPLQESKKRMPYWDMFPVVIVTDLNPRGWTGMNLHYLPPKMRVMLLGQLYNIYQDRHMDERKQLQISYDYLQRTNAHPYIKPTIHRYRPGGLRSQVYVVPPEDWARVALLPLQKFQKQPDEVVWQDARKHLRGM